MLKKYNVLGIFLNLSLSNHNFDHLKIELTIGETWVQRDTQNITLFSRLGFTTIRMAVRSL